ncbi:hypothetical protein [Aureibacillus halotolerans]|uniref:P/Homo B domain-containing protein n=1 Tax=Aureibacillus halotolerans TaxID=1508390 RepID=A0A4R6U5P4_9BACI|nr:hypothetical protein [Aureibacillus halotolerans]TDQ39815.1 hypothetical protein EV213_107183 [Aureibacillus halotolerans]
MKRKSVIILALILFLTVVSSFAIASLGPENTTDEVNETKANQSELANREAHGELLSEGKLGNEDVNVGGEIGKFNVILLDDVSVSGKFFGPDWDLAPGNGDELNVLVRNNHASSPVELEVIYTPLEGIVQEFGPYEIDPSWRRTQNFTMTDGNGMEGNWEIYITSQDGHTMNLNVSAGQF